jgi:hypothetical protein
MGPNQPFLAALPQSYSRCNSHPQHPIQLHCSIDPQLISSRRLLRNQWRPSVPGSNEWESSPVSA